MNLVSCSSCSRQFDIIYRGWNFHHCGEHGGIEPIPEGAERGNWQGQFSGRTRRETSGVLPESDPEF